MNLHPTSKVDELKRLLRWGIPQGGLTPEGCQEAFDLLDAALKEAREEGRQDACVPDHNWAELNVPDEHKLDVTVRAVCLHCDAERSRT